MKIKLGVLHYAISFIIHRINMFKQENIYFDFVSQFSKLQALVH